MFTGIIEEIGHVSSVTNRGKIMDIVIEAKTILDDMKIGDSIAISGVCQTVTEIGNSTFTVQAVEETLKRSTFGSLKRGTALNLERALRSGDRFGGHLVQGHVDGTGRIASKKEFVDNVLFSIIPEPGLDRYIAEKGSIAVDGISLTVTFAPVRRTRTMAGGKKGEFGVSIIPHTVASTTVNTFRVGDTVNLETDIIAKYIEKLLVDKNSLTINRLKELGF